MRLKTKFSVFTTFFVVTVALGLSALFLIFEARYLVRRGREGQLSLARDAAKICRESVIMEDELFAMNYFNSAVQARGVIYLSFADTSGEIQIHTDTSLIGTLITPEMAGDSEGSEEALLHTYQDSLGETVSVASMPVMVSDTRLGTVFVGFSEGILRDSIQESIAATTRRIIAVTLIMLIIGIISALILASKMIDPIDRLAWGARRIGDGSLDHRIDVTSRDELGELSGEFNAMAERLKELDDMKDNFVYSLTHDLRSPLSAVMGYISLMLKGVFDPLTRKQESTLKDVKSICHRLLDLIGDILDYAKVKSGSIEIEPEEADFRQIIQGIIKTLEPLGREKNVTLEAEMPPEPVPAFIDAGKVERLTVNLVSNALKFTPEGGSVKVTLSRGPGDIQVSVSDTGIGIPPEHIDTIFGEFTQLREHQKHSRIKGTGIGLSIAKAIVEAHGGKIWVESEMEKGTVFHYTVPDGRKNSGPLNKTPDDKNGQEEKGE